MKATPDLVLSTRLQLVKQNLATVRNVIKTIEGVRNGLEKVLAPFESQRLLPALRTVRNEIETARDRAQGNRDAQDALKSALNTLNDILSSIDDDDARAAVNLIRNRSGYLKREVRTTIEDNLLDEAERLETHYRSIETTLLDPDADDAVVDAAWRSYQKELPKAQAVFAEYVDFLAGVAVRDAGYDEGICQTADEMVQEFAHSGDLSWRSLTIPTRRQYLEVPKARMVRLGFPEWSLWTVPLSAYVWASIVVNNRTVFKKFLEELPGDQRDVGRVLLTDAVATSTMGPAYACALILIRLDPTDQRPMEGALAHSRAETVLAMLDQIADVSHGGDAYRRIIGKLRDSWHRAFSVPAGGVDSATMPSIPAIVAVAADRNFGSELGDDAWSRISMWAKDLRAGIQLQPSDVQTTDTPQVVLNAAWVARVQNIEPAVELSVLAERAREYWRVIQNGDQNESAGSGGLPGADVPKQAP